MAERLRETPSQTAGPYLHIGLTPNTIGIAGVYPHDLGSRMRDEATPGRHIAIEGRVFDGAGEPLRDCVVEIWQADSEGRYAPTTEGVGFIGWGRAAADPETGSFRFETVKPGAVPFTDGREQAPHVSVWIVARGMTMGLSTRMYFSDEAEANAADPVLGLVDRSRVPTLIGASNGDTYRFDIHLQGPDETVFFDI